MKKISELGQYISIFLFGYIIFNFIITNTQIILYSIWGLILDFYNTFVNNLKELYIIYIIFFIIATIINYVYNYYYIYKLNNSLKIIKGIKEKYNEK